MKVALPVTFALDIPRAIDHTLPSAAREQDGPQVEATTR